MGVSFKLEREMLGDVASERNNLSWGVSCRRFYDDDFYWVLKQLLSAFFSSVSWVKED